jgi:cytochrome b involved in lipid metabolism
LLLNPELGIPTFEDLQAVDWAWVRAEASETKVLIVVRQWVLDVTDFKSRHPGGSAL